MHSKLPNLGTLAPFDFKHNREMNRGYLPDGEDVHDEEEIDYDDERDYDDESNHDEEKDLQTSTPNPSPQLPPSPPPHPPSNSRSSGVQIRNTLLFPSIYILFHLTFTTPTPPRLRSNALIAYPDAAIAHRQLQLKQNAQPGCTVVKGMSTTGIAPRNMVDWVVLKEPERKDGTVVKHVYWVESVEMTYEPVYEGLGKRTRDE